ncbi:hypothetical protein D3C84_812250 [compost metagenome]
MPNSTAKNSTDSSFASDIATKTLSGTMFCTITRAPFEGSIVMDAELCVMPEISVPVPGSKMFAKHNPITMARPVIAKKYPSDFMPMRPNDLLSPPPAMPRIMQQNTIGTTTIFIILMKISPSGFRISALTQD